MHPSRTKSDRVTIWGLSSRSLNEAWWRGRGVQVVEAGTNFERCRGAELFLLTPASRLVVFDLGDIVERVIWSRSPRIRLGVVERDHERYREAIVRDHGGKVLGLSRLYSSEPQESATFVISSESKDAAIWAEGGSSAAELIHSIGSRDSEEVLGHVYDCNRGEEEERFLAWLVASWSDPHRVIDGIKEVERGVFAASGSAEHDFEVIPPVWIGLANDDAGSDQRILAGPDFFPDQFAGESAASDVAVREIRDVGVSGGVHKKRLLPRRTFYGLFKRIYDFTIAGLALLVLSPLLLLTCVLVVVDDGFPVFFGHERQSRGGRNFKCLKFRTMRRNAEDMVEELQALNMADGPQVFIENDPRVTRIGHSLRRLQIDELPQLWNVVRGDMSFVGPRPSPERENQFCPAWREMRLSVRPGITGLWQLRRTRAPGEDFQEWIKYDVEYVRSASTLLDLKVLFLTVLQIFGRRS